MLHIKSLLVINLHNDGQKSGLPTFWLVVLWGARLRIAARSRSKAAACSTT